MGPYRYALGHLIYCINFFPMSTLCAMDMTLGPANAFARNYTCDRVRGEHVHMDWPGFYDKMKTNYVGYQKKVQAELEDMARVGGNTHIYKYIIGGLWRI